MTRAKTAQEAVVTQYRWDISKYVGDRARVVRRIFDLMPSEVSQASQHPEQRPRDRKRGIERAYVLCEGNVEADGPVAYLPVYMAMFL